MSRRTVSRTARRTARTIAKPAPAPKPTVVATKSVTIPIGNKVQRDSRHPATQESPQQVNARAESKPAPVASTVKSANRAASLQGFSVTALRELCEQEHGADSWRKSWTRAKVIEKLTGVAPAPKPGTNAALRAECKAAGIKGVSSLTKASLQASLAAGKAVKPAPNPGTMAANRILVMAAKQRGVDTVGVCKQLFGAKSSPSALKAAELAKLVAHLRLS